MIKSRNYLVLHKPAFRSDSTVDKIKVIDAFSMHHGSIQDAMEVMERSVSEYKAKFGEGRIELVEQDGNERFI